MNKVVCFISSPAVHVYCALFVLKVRLLKPLAGFAGYNNEMRELAAVISRVSPFNNYIIMWYMYMQYINVYSQIIKLADGEYWLKYKC